MERFLARLFRAHELPTPQILIKSNFTQGLQRIVETRDVVALIPSLLLQDIEGEGRLVSLETPLGVISADTVLAYRPHAPAAGRLRSLIALLRKRYDPRGAEAP